MKWISTRGRSPAVPFIDALFAGTAPDGGLYMPERLDPLPPGTVESLRGAGHRRDRDPDRGASAPGRDCARCAAFTHSGRARLSDPPRPDHRPRVGARAVSRPDAGVQGCRRPRPGPPASSLHRRHAADDPGGDLRGHRQRRRTGFPRRSRHARCRAVPGREGQRRPGSADGVAWRQRDRPGDAWNVRRLPAAGQAGVCRRRSPPARVADAGQLDQPRPVAAAGVLLLRAGYGRRTSGYGFAEARSPKPEAGANRFRAER